MMDKKLSNLAWYLKEKKWPLFPCDAEKHPLTAHGFKDASMDFEQIEKWHAQFPEANWAIPTGEITGTFVLDVDAKNETHKEDGIATLAMLREQYSDPIETPTQKTGGGGVQYFFKHPAGHAIKNGTNVLGPGIDLRTTGGYVLIPPSKTVDAYHWELHPQEYDFQEVPGWILQRLTSRPETAAPQIEDAPTEKQRGDKNFVIAQSALQALHPDRMEDYQKWLEVGMSLFELGEPGLIMWDGWSRQSPKYKQGDCAQKWKTFNKELTAANKITFGSLIHWAEEDGQQPFIKRCPKNAEPQDYADFLVASGYRFTMNSMNDGLYVNDIRMSDPLEASITFKARTYGYKSKIDTETAMKKTALDNQFHPIKDYLESLILDGSQDHIKKLASYFEDKDGLFPLLLRKFLLGAVERVLGSRPEQPPMWVLDGKQNMGKSRFAWFLGSPLPAFFMQGPIEADNKDSHIELCSKWIWELDELDSTFRKSEQAALKSFITREYVTFRAPYGHFDITKRATAAFIGTINNVAGFLVDPTGNRRYRVCTMTKIDWNYEKDVDINQVWAQARELYLSGETYKMDSEQEKKIQAVTSEYEVEDAMMHTLITKFNVEPGDRDHYTAPAEIMSMLDMPMGQDVRNSMRLAAVLFKLGCTRERIMISGHKVTVWRGVWLKTVGGM